MALLEAGSQKEALSKDGRTALAYAATYGSVACVKALLESGADKEAMSRDGRTVLAWAATYENALCVRALVDAEASLEAACMSSGMTQRKIEHMVTEWKPGNTGGAFRMAEPMTNDDGQVVHSKTVVERWMYPGPWMGQHL